MMTHIKFNKYQRLLLRIIKENELYNNFRLNDCWYLYLQMNTVKDVIDAPNVIVTFWNLIGYKNTQNVIEQFNEAIKNDFDGYIKDALKKTLTQYPFNLNGKKAKNLYDKLWSCIVNCKNNNKLHDLVYTTYGIPIHLHPFKYALKNQNMITPDAYTTLILSFSTKLSKIKINGKL